MHKLIDNDEMVNFYTGLPNYPTLMALFNSLKPAVEAKGQGRARKLSLENEFLATLMRLRLGLLNQDIADRFSIAQSTFSRMFIRWIGIMYQELKILFPWPSKQASGILEILLRFKLSSLNMRAAT